MFRAGADMFPPRIGVFDILVLSFSVFSSFSALSQFAGADNGSPHVGTLALFFCTCFAYRCSATGADQFSPRIRCCDFGFLFSLFTSLLLLQAPTCFPLTWEKQRQRSGEPFGSLGMPRLPSSSSTRSTQSSATGAVGARQALVEHGSHALA